MKTTIPMSKKLQEKIQNEGIEKDVFSHIQKLNTFETLFYWIIDTKFRTSVNLKSWLKEQDGNAQLAKIVEDNGWKNIKNKDNRVLAILKFFQNGKYLTYTGDLKQYERTDYWATVKETLATQKGDCDDGAILVYHACRLAGIDDTRLYLVAGDVIGGGHCYLVYVADDGVEYPIDWCYWADKSLTMLVPYFNREDYYYGEKEWFRVNCSGLYRQKEMKI